MTVPGRQAVTRHQKICFLVIALSLLMTVWSDPASSRELRLGPALSGNWYDLENPGQGLFVDASAEGDIFMGGWFSYPRDGEPGTGAHRWWTIEGPYIDSDSELTIYLTSGGEFLGGGSVQSFAVGSARVAFPDCHTLVLDFVFDDGEQGRVTMNRLLPVPGNHCDLLFSIRESEYVLTADKPVVFRDISVVSMQSQDPLSGDGPSSVLVRDGVIQAIGPFSALGVPPGATVIDGRDRYLMPGLVDTHTHLAVNVTELQGFATPAMLELVSTNQLQLYLANGVTTIFNLGDFGEPMTSWAREIIEGERIGPTIHAAKYARGAPGSCDGGPQQVTVGNSFQAGVDYVREAADQGYRFIKIYNCTPPAAVDGIMAEASSQNLSVAGHFPADYDTTGLLLEPVFSLVAHSNAFLWNGYLNLGSSPGARGQVISRMMNGETALSSTLRIAEQIAQVWCHNQGGIDTWMANAALELMHFTEIELHQRSMTSGRFGPQGCSIGGFNGDLLFARDMARRVVAAGGELLTGTDSPTVLGVAGLSMHEELQALMRAGLTLEQTLAAATANAGRYFHRTLPGETRLGEVRAGFRADLLVLDRHPREALDDFAASLDMVMARGAVYPRAVRDSWLDRIRAEYDIRCPPYCRP